MKIRTQRKEHVVTVERDGQEWPFSVSPLDPAEEAEIRKKHTSYVRISGQLLPEVDFAEIKIEKAQSVIRSWPCVDENDQEIPCSDEKKREAWLLNPDLIDEVLRKAGEIGAGRAAEEKKT
ncbi:MAG TPA: hypothetical protein DHV36_15765 [Desulfobacteraceae bacterium]|nr:hypothetical protein [Desulfobacteraceae bacterium]|tara:strand:+ start:1418 stop:1780 length:363 start_codon:yes stop_codon:yes gene_type:complete